MELQNEFVKSSSSSGRRPCIIVWQFVIVKTNVIVEQIQKCQSIHKENWPLCFP